MNHNEARTRHFLRRVAERYRYNMTRQEYNELLAQIKNSQSQFLHKISNAYTVHRVKYRDQPMIVVYACLPGRKRLVTCYTPEQWKANEEAYDYESFYTDLAACTSAD
jgi:hypothetical protein